MPIVPLFASAAPAASSDGLLGLMPLLIIVAVFYFLLIRPQQKQHKEHAGFLTRVKAGDQVLTHSGMIGKIVSIDSGVVILEIARDTKVRFLLRNLAGPYSPSEK
ncbi:MAG: preprotein translocase subunit YajC [Myxococcota bacterium]|nr:preprotein translocase subunit YajC [Myxococcota bacterium]